jgi:hypothetical protein
MPLAAFAIPHAMQTAVLLGLGRKEASLQGRVEIGSNRADTVGTRCHCHGTSVIVRPGPPSVWVSALFRDAGKIDTIQIQALPPRTVDK